ncbi:MAG: alanine dehydrogenase, partial [Flavobacteriales bacterium]
KEADMFYACHYWDSRSPEFFTKEDIKSNDFNIKVIADISCDIGGPVPTTIRTTSIDSPIYGYDRFKDEETDMGNDNAIAVMAVDNLPCELPKDASYDFGHEFIDKVLPHLEYKERSEILKRATIAKDGELMPDYKYLEEFVEG